MIAWVGVFVGAGLVAALCAVVPHDRRPPAADDALRASLDPLALMAGVLGPTALGPGLSARDGLLVGSAAAVGVVAILAAHRVLPYRTQRPRRPRSRVAPVMPALEHVVSPATGAAA